MDLNIFVDYIFDDTTRAGLHRRCRSWVRFHVHRLEWMIKCHIGEANISDAVVVVVRNYSPQRHPHAIMHLNISHCNVFRAFYCFLLIAGLWYNGIVKIGDFYSLDGDVAPARIYTIGVQSVCGQTNIKIWESFLDKH